MFARKQALFYYLRLSYFSLGFHFMCHSFGLFYPVAQGLVSQD